MREREIHQKTIENEVKIRPKIDAKSIQISYSKSDAKNTENHPKLSSKGSQKPSKNLSKIDSKKRSENGGPAHPTRESSQPGKGSFGALQKDNKRQTTTFEDKPHLSNTPWAPAGPGADILGQGSPRASRASRQGGLALSTRKVSGPIFFEDFSHWFSDAVFSCFILKFNELWLPFGTHFG
jgi:hypothetical protein